MNRPGKPLVHILLLIVCGIAMTLPVLLYGVPELSNDGQEHSRTDHNFAAQFWDGEAYPRWLTNVSSGFGSPVMFYYPPMESYAASLFWPFVHNRDPFGLMITGYACILATILSGITAYWWLRAMVDGRSAVAGALLYMIAPYHLAIDLYNRGDAGEYWLFVWAPLAMLAADRITRKSPYGLVGLVLSYALCVFAHPTVSACFAAVPVIYVFMFSERAVRIRTALAACCAIALGIGLTAIFLCPAFFDQYKSWASAYTGGSGDYHNWWLFSVRDKITELGTQAVRIPWYLGFKMRILVITISTLLFCVVSYWVIRRMGSPDRNRRLAGFYLGVVIAFIFMMERLSDFIWRIVPIFKYLQSPSRLLILGTMASAALAAMAFHSLTARGARLAGLFLFTIVLGWLGADAVGARQAYSRWRHIPPERAAHDSLSRQYEEEYSSLWPITAQAGDLYPVEKFAPFVAAHPPKAAHVDVPSGTVSIESWRPRKVLLKVDLPAPGQLTLNHFYFEGWRAGQVGSDREIAVTPSKPDGFIVADLPAGNYELSMELSKDRPEQWGWWISLISVGLTGVLAMWSFAGARKARSAAA